MSKAVTGILYSAGVVAFCVGAFMYDADIKREAPMPSGHHGNYAATPVAAGEVFTGAHRSEYKWLTIKDARRDIAGMCDGYGKLYPLRIVYANDSEGNDYTYCSEYIDDRSTVVAFVTTYLAGPQHGVYYIHSKPGNIYSI